VAAEYKTMISGASELQSSDLINDNVPTSQDETLFKIVLFFIIIHYIKMVLRSI